MGKRVQMFPDYPGLTVEASLARWCQSLDVYQDPVLELATFLRERAQFARDELPTSHRLAEHLELLAVRAEKIAEAVPALRPHAENLVLEELQRLTAPRRNIQAEMRADHQAAADDDA